MRIVKTHLFLLRRCVGELMRRGGLEIIEHENSCYGAFDAHNDIFDAVILKTATNFAQLYGCVAPINEKPQECLY